MTDGQPAIKKILPIPLIVILTQYHQPPKHNKRGSEMNKKTIAAAGFLVVTVLQGISYPSVALGNELIQTQNQSTSQQDDETPSQDSEESTSSEEGNSNTTQSDGPSLAPTTPTPSAQTDNEDTSDAVSENEPLEEQHAESNPQDDPNKPENGWDENKQHYYENGVMVVDKDVFIPDAPDNRKLVFGFVSIRTAT